MVATLLNDPWFKARRLLDAAQRPLGDIAAVMGSPPTITDPASDGANSTVQTGEAVGGGTFLPTDTARVAVFGGPLSGGRIQTITRVSGARVQGHGAGIAFYTDADTVDFSLRCNGSKWIAYVTTPDGVRARIATNDRSQAYANYNYYKLAFGSTAPAGRLVEIYLGDAGNYGGINVPTGYSIWAADLAHQPRIACVWDSFAEGSMNDTNVNRKLAVGDWFGAMFGVNNPFVNAVGSTGVIADAGASNYSTFGERIAAGDMDSSRVGHFDLILAPGSVNDGFTSVNGLNSPAGDATVQAAYAAYIAALMVAQPYAIIVGASQQFSTIAAISTRTAAYKAGFQASAGTDPRMIWMDASLFESAPDADVIGADNIHPDGADGARHIGERLARRTLTYLQAIAEVA